MDSLDDIRAVLADLNHDQLAALVADLPDPAAEALLRELDTSIAEHAELPAGPLEQAQQLDPAYRTRPHLTYLSGRLAQAVCDVEQGRNRWLMVQMPPRSGKQIADREWVLTTQGWKRHGDLAVGDQVFSPSGEPTTVRAVSAPSNEKMRVTFSDGSSVLAHPAHEWTVYDRAVGRWRTVETQYMAGRALWPKGSRGKRGDRMVLQLPSIEPLQMPEVDLPVDPYTFGVWLGDGTTGKASICGSQEDLERILPLIPYTLGARWIHQDTKVHYQYIKGGFSKALRAVGAFRDKHIPEMYLLASERQRRSLLAGIVDTDGTVDKTGRVTVTSSNIRLITDIRSLVRTLGYRAGFVHHDADSRDRRIQGGEYWSVSWTPLDGHPPGRALRRKTACRHGVKRRIGVAAVDPAPDEPGRCIEVDGGHYLVGQALLPTHNSQLSSVYLPVWLLRAHPGWKIGLISHSPHLAVSWGRQVRRLIEEHGPQLGLSIARDAGAAADWQTTQRGGITSRSAPGQSITGLGFKVMILDDLTKDFATAHSATARDAIWDWWQANSLTRLEPPSLVVATATRWHEDDFLGRNLSPEYDGNSDQWEVINFPAIADTDDVLGRRPGDPLYSPLLDETRDEALTRWADIKTAVGSYMWSSLYQQAPSPAQGAIFDVGWWRYWTTDPSRATDDGKVVYLNPLADLQRAKWVDSWDMAFKATQDSDYVVGQRWARQGNRRFLIAQQRNRWSFTQTIEAMLRWGDGGGPYGHFVHERLVEDKANGTAVIDTLREKISGLIPVNPTESKEARARSVTPEVEAGNVYLPHPSDSGNEWVTDLLSELREFNSGTHDDQVDALTQALRRLRDPGRGHVSVPGRLAGPVRRGLGGNSTRAGYRTAAR